MEIVVAIFLLLMAGVAYITFRALKSTVKMAMRLVLVFVILAVAGVGSMALWSISGDSPAKTPTSKSRKKK